MYLGLDLSPQAQKQLDALNARLVIVQEKIAALTAIIASPNETKAKKQSATYWLKIRQKELVALQAKIAKLTGTPPPPPPTPPPPVPPTPPVPTVPMTPVWIDPVTGVPVPIPPTETPTVPVDVPAVVTTPTMTYVIIGGIILLFLMRGRSVA